MDTKHTPARCKNCRWIHEADSTKGTSYMGVELCPQHASAPELLEALGTIQAQLKDAWARAHYEEIRVAMQTARAAIAKATS